MTPLDELEYQLKITRHNQRIWEDEGNTGKAEHFATRVRTLEAQITKLTSKAA